jgi:hypothetical protein
MSASSVSLTRAAPCDGVHVQAEAPYPMMPYVDAPPHEIAMIDVVGMQYKRAGVVEAAYHARRPGEAAVVVAEPENKFDKWALRVEVAGHAVGYIPKAHQHLAHVGLAHISEFARDADGGFVLVIEQQHHHRAAHRR